MGLILWPLALAISNMTTLSSQDAAPAPVPPPRPATGFLYQEIEFNGEKYAYSVYVPPEYTPGTQWPCILFLHGSGERGRDGLLQTEVGIATAIRRHRDWCPAIVVMPQCRPDKWWSDAMVDMALKCLEDTSRNYRLDSQRLYLTGLSLGGNGTWFIASRFPGRFAAIVPICGFVFRPDQPSQADTLAKVAESLKSTPIWCFHGAKDRAVPADRSKEMIEALQKVEGRVKYTEYPDGEHNVWDRAYGDRKLWEWLLAQRLPDKVQPASKPAK